MKPKLKDVLKKDAKDLNDEEKSVLHENWDLLNEEIRAKYKDVAPEEGGDNDDDEGDDDDKEKGIDEETLGKVIDEKAKGIISKKAEEIATALVKTFQEKMEVARKNIVVASDDAKAKIKENNELVRKSMVALRNNDRKALVEISGKKAIDTTEDGSGADAGYLIPEPLANEVMRLPSTGYGVARQIFGYNLLSGAGNTKRITALGSTLSVYWIDEGGKKKSSQPSFSIVTLALKKLAVIVPMTEEVVEDSGVDLLSLVAQLIREAFDKEEDLQFFMGDGTVWTGIFKDTSIPTTELAANADIDDMRPEDITGLIDSTDPSVNGAFLMHRTVLAKIRSLRENADGTGAYLYNPLGLAGGRFGDLPAGTLAGRPVILAEAAPTAASAVSATGDNLPIMMYGDFKLGVAYGEKSDIRFKLLDQATITDVDDTTVINLAEQDMIALRAVKRVGMKVVLPSAMRRLVNGD
jgi:HK97 family phage major capsid protein